MNDFFNYLIRLANYSAYCSTKPFRLSACHELWVFLFYLVEFILLVIIYITVRKIFKNRSDFKAYLIRKARRAKVADPAIMEQYRWKGLD